MSSQQRLVSRVHVVFDPPKSNRKIWLGRAGFGLAFLVVVALCGCQDLIPRDARSLLIPRFQRSEIVGFLAGLGTTFAAVPDLLAMIRRRSAAGMNPRMPALMGAFQILWVYYGLLILSRPVIAWNVVGFLINFVCVGVYVYLSRKPIANHVVR